MKAGDYIEANAKWRWVLLGYVLVLVVLSYLFIQSLEELKPLFDGVDKKLDVAILELNVLFIYLLFFSIVHALALSIFFIKLANKSRHTKLFPPSENWVLVKTQIKTGAKAKRAVVFCYILALLVWLTTFIPLYLMWLLDIFSTQ